MPVIGFGSYATPRTGTPSGTSAPTPTGPAAGAPSGPTSMASSGGKIIGPAARYIDPSNPRAGTLGGAQTGPQAIHTSQSWPYTQLPYAPFLSFDNNPNPLNNYQAQSTSVEQAPTNVYQGAQYQIPGQLAQATSQANQIASGRYNPNLSNLGSSYNTNFQNSSDLAPYMNGGVDYLGRLGISEGASNILAQQGNANRALQNSLGRQAGNRSLINVLQNQNAFRSQLAMNPLYSEAQRGSYERALGNVGLNNQALQASNTAQQAQAGFNNQNQLQAFQARLAALQPQQNLLDYLATLQGQARGLASQQNDLSGKNFD